MRRPSPYLQTKSLISQEEELRLVVPLAGWPFPAVVVAGGGPEVVPDMERFVEHNNGDIGGERKVCDGSAGGEGVEEDEGDEERGDEAPEERGVGKQGKVAP